jgi:hypothetical protein
VEVIDYSKTAIGGPKTANLIARGSKNALWEFADMTRAPIEIWDDDRHKRVWWGILAESKIKDDNITRIVSLYNMANSAAVAYTLNQYRYTTTWGTDTDSIDEFGTKQILLTAEDVSETQAESIRDSHLDKSKYPDMTDPLFGTAGDDFAKLKAIGYFDTIAWQYYNQPEGLESFSDVSTNYGREIGEDNRPECAQSFSISSTDAWDAYFIYLRVYKGGDPTDSVIVELCADTGVAPDNYPGSVLGTATLTYDNFTTSKDWIKFTLSATVTLSPLTTYWIKIRRTGAVDLDNYYIVDTNDFGGYEKGVFKIHNTGTDEWYKWNYTNPGVEMDMNFRVAGQEESTVQISNIISEWAEFIHAADIVDDSSVFRNQWRYGDQTALYELLNLLKMGTAAGRRLLARVLENKHLEIYTEPALYAADYAMDRDRNLTDASGAPVNPADCPVGVWLKYPDTIPSTVNTTQLLNAVYGFVEESQYNAISNEYKILKSRNVSQIGPLFGIKHG